MRFDELMKNPIPDNMKKVSNITESTECAVSQECDNATQQNNIVPPVETAPVQLPVDDSTSVEDLTPDESRRVDDVMNVVATPLLLSSELDECGIKEFVESIESDIAVAEGFLTERTIVRFDKNAKKAQLYEVAVRACAREKKDPLYRKLETVEKMKRILEAKLRKKYDSPAKKKLKEYLDRAKKSKSGILAKIAHKLSGK